MSVTATNSQSVRLGILLELSLQYRRIFSPLHSVGVIRLVVIGNNVSPRPWECEAIHLGYVLLLH